MFCLPEVAHSTGLQIVLPNPLCYTSGASIDTRTMEPGDLFVALPSVRDDGHRYLDQAFGRGASGAIISKSFFESHHDRLESAAHLFHNLIVASDPQVAFLELARWYRAKFKIRTIGITGSVGKTSTKEFLHYLIRQKYPAIANIGNLNNSLGLPLTLFRIRPSDRYCIAELGARRPGEIYELAQVLQPDAAVMTQISPVHLASYGNLDTIYATKTEILECLVPGSFVVLPDDDPILIDRVRRFPVKTVKVGETKASRYRISKIQVQNQRVHFVMNEKKSFSFPGMATFLAKNAALAIAMADSLGIPFNEMPGLWNDLKLPAGRFERRQLEGGFTVIFDGYNASPITFERALEAFQSLLTNGRKIMVFSDMLELGPEEVEYHRWLGRKIAHSRLDCVLAYGNLARVSVEWIRKEHADFCVEYFKDQGEIAQYLRHFLKPGDTLLLKASRGMKIEEIVEQLELLIATK